MREILYVQAGNLANYIGTHFWNTQESYFTYSDDEAVVNHDTSFREGETSKGDPTYCPRLIAFDRKGMFNLFQHVLGLTGETGNFGTFAKTNLFAETDDRVTQLWQGPISEHEHEPIEPHAYQTHLEADQDDNEIFSTDANIVRYWSDFSRVFYNPRTAQMLPDVPEWQNTEGDWAVGQETFERFNDETELMESSVRLFIEECNSFQGLQLMNDTSTFGAFSSSFLMAFYDELSKAPCLSFPLLGDAVPRNANWENTIHLKKVVNDAVYLRELNNLSILAIPILSPKAWSQGNLNLKFNDSNYHMSAILSAHIESSTAPLRLKGRPETISSFSAQLNFYGPHRFCQLSGVFPVAAVSTPQTFWKHSYNFSVPRDTLTTAYYTRKDITRGFQTSTLHAYESWYSEMSIKEPLATSIHAPAYPLPSSFPNIFPDQEVLCDYRQKNTEGKKVPLSTPMFTSLTTNSDTGEMFGDYAKFIQVCVDRRKTGILTGLIENLDDMKELVNDLWTIRDGYSTDGLESGNN